MIEQIQVFNEQGDLFSLDLDNDETGITVQDIRGLEPVKADVITSPFARRPGAHLQATRRGSRNIVFTLGLDPRFGETVEELRHSLYSAFDVEHQVDMRFTMSGGRILHILGTVESNEPVMFAKEMEAQISVICTEPDFFNPTEVVGSGVAGELLDSTLIDYTGTVPTGLKLELFLPTGQSTNGFTIHHTAPNGSEHMMEFDVDLVAFDTMVVDTTPGQKSVTLIRASNPTPMLYAISPQSQWFSLEKGENVLGVTVNSGGATYEYSYIRKYGGL